MIPAKLGTADLLDRMQTTNMFSINMVWVLLCGRAGHCMQFGFAIGGDRLARAKNAAHTSRGTSDLPIGRHRVTCTGLRDWLGQLVQRTCTYSLGIHHRPARSSEFELDD